MPSTTVCGVHTIRCHDVDAFGFIKRLSCVVLCFSHYNHDSLFVYVCVLSRRKSQADLCATQRRAGASTVRVVVDLRVAQIYIYHALEYDESTSFFFFQFGKATLSYGPSAGKFPIHLEPRLPE